MMLKSLPLSLSARICYYYLGGEGRGLPPDSLATGVVHQTVAMAIHVE